MRLPNKVLICLLLILFISGAFNPSSVLAKICGEKGDNAQEADDIVLDCNRKLQELSGQKQTLTTALNTLNIQINLIQAQVAKTEKDLTALADDIAALGIKIGQIDQSLEHLSEVMVVRVRETYKQSYLEPVYLLFTSQGFPDFVNRIKYIRSVQNHDKNVFVAMEQIKLNYDTQKNVKENKQAEVEGLKLKLNKQKSSLAARQQEKKTLLEITKNDEKKYQDLLSKAQAELNAIQNIIAGRGEETKIREITEGSKIALVIPTKSACSSGAHLHFEVVKNGANFNPFNYLSNKSVDWDNADSQPAFTGDWNWPINDRARITQGYGKTSYSTIYANGFHTGVDMVNAEKNYDVKAVKKGILFRGAIACGGGTLRYVKVDHEDGISTYYLHVNYI